ncbi:FAD-dependent oxidoreductase [Okibacterium endophyticum]
MRAHEERYDVVVIGAGLVGLAATAFLSQQGLRVVTLERHRSTSTHPKARLVTVRSMELYRSLGIEEEVRAAGEANSGFSVVDTLAGDLETWIAPPEDEVAAVGLSPTMPYSCDQHRLEPILLRRAIALGATVRFGVSAALQHVDDEGVVVELDASGETSEVRARYLVAADGSRSGVREQLGIRLHGEPVEGESVSAVFRADLDPALRGREINAVMCRTAGAFLFARGNREDRGWQVGTYLRPGWADLDDEGLKLKLVDVIREATGLADLNPVIEDVATWSTGAYVADRLRSGPVFLVGDAAHIMPPYGGFGGNTGVQDAHNLAWRITARCRGAAPENILDGYERERLPLIELTVAQALLRSRKKPGQAPPADEIDAQRLVLGFRYPLGGGASPHDLVEDPAEPSGGPGTRAPHVLLADGRSTLDLVDPTRFTLIGPGANGLPPVHTDLTAAPVRTIPVSEDAVDSRHRERWRATYAAPGRSGLLVRPDGVVAAQVPAGEPPSVIDAVHDG